MEEVPADFNWGRVGIPKKLSLWPFPTNQP
jgi:hypothetical protein